jgi:hypothetical protein
MANSFNGIGTTFFGKSKFAADGSFVTTKWFVVGFFPLVPLGSLRVRDLGTSGMPFLSRTTEYDVLEELPVDWMQVLRTWIYAAFIVSLVVGVAASDWPPAMKVLTMLAGVLLPHALRFAAARSAP